MDAHGFSAEVTWANCGHRVPPEIYGLWLDDVLSLY